MGLLGKEDYIIWNYAKKHDFIILTQDEDYLDLSQLRGHPPKVILLKTGNITTDGIEELLRKKYSTIEFFISPDYDYGCIEIYS